MSVERLTFNGINGTTGAYGLRQMTPTELVQRIQESRSLGPDSGELVRAQAVGV